MPLYGDILQANFFDLQKTLFKILAGVSKIMAAFAFATAFEFCTDEDNSVNRSAMDALRNSKKKLPF